MLPVLAGAAPRYSVSVSVVGVPDSIAYDINSSGTVVGEYDNFGQVVGWSGTAADGHQRFCTRAARCWS